MAGKIKENKVASILRSIKARLSSRTGESIPCALKGCMFYKVGNNDRGMTFYAPSCGLDQFHTRASVGVEFLQQRTALIFRSDDNLKLSDMRDNFWSVIQQIEMISSCVGFATKITRASSELGVPCRQLQASSDREVWVYVFLSELASLADQDKVCQLLNSFKPLSHAQC